MERDQLANTEVQLKELVVKLQQNIKLLTQEQQNVMDKTQNYFIIREAQREQDDKDFRNLVSKELNESKNI